MPHGSRRVGVRRCVRSEGSAARRTAAELALRCRLQRAKREGDLPKNADPAELAHDVMTVVRGMAVQSAGGASCDQLLRVAQIALRASPTRLLVRRLSYWAFFLNSSLD